MGVILSLRINIKSIHCNKSDSDLCILITCLFYLMNLKLIFNRYNNWTQSLNVFSDAFFGLKVLFSSQVFFLSVLESRYLFSPAPGFWLPPKKNYRLLRHRLPILFLLTASDPSKNPRHPGAAFRVFTGTAFGSGSLRIGLEAQANNKLFLSATAPQKKFPAPASGSQRLFFVVVILGG